MPEFSMFNSDKEFLQFEICLNSVDIYGNYCLVGVGIPSSNH